MMIAVMDLISFFASFVLIWRAFYVIAEMTKPYKGRSLGVLTFMITAMFVLILILIIELANVQVCFQ